MGKKSLAAAVIIAFAIALLSSIAAGYSNINVKVVNDHIIFGQRAVFNVTIENLRDTTQVYDISSSTGGIGWSVQTRPLRDQSLTVGPGAKKMIEVVVEPIDKYPAGVYLVGLDITTSMGERYERPLKVYMGPVVPLEYLPSLRTDIRMNDNIDPRQTQSIIAVVENLNPLDLTNMSVKIISDITAFNAEQIVDLGPNEKKTLEFTIKIPDIQQPKDYVVFFQFQRGEQIIKVDTKKIEIVALMLPFEQKIEERESLLKRTSSITFTNKGNIIDTQLMSVPYGFFKGLFTTTEPRAKVVEYEGRRALGWDVQLGPGEEASVVAVTNYRIPVVVLILLIAGFLIYRAYKNPIAITKKASNVDIKEDGGVAGLKVTLLVKNLSNKAVKDIEVVDEIPSITNLEKDVDAGTVKPTQMLRGRHGRIFVKWRFGELESKEERVITYRIRSRLDILGTIRLARAKAMFVSSGGKKNMSYSNTYRVMTEE